jgi:HlyD family secretion protein
MNKPIVRIALLAVLVLAAGFGVWWWLHGRSARDALTLYGNIDLRQVDLAFNDSERVSELLVKEGDKVSRGQVLARLDTGRLQPQLDQAEALADAQQSAVEKLHRGNRPQEIAQARANLAQDQADAADAEAKRNRDQDLWDRSQGKAMSRQDLDDAISAAKVADAKVAAQQQALELEVLGPRKEDIDQAEAQLRADRAQVALLKRQVADAELIAPLNAVVRSRVLEPGDMASPQKTAFSLAILDPKWVRAYVSEPDLGQVRQGERATVSVDAFPGRSFSGWVGFISPMAEFTPKSVETSDLRSSLVYEIRIFVDDPADQLRLGMPATVTLPLAPGARR